MSAEPILPARSVPTDGSGPVASQRGLTVGDLARRYRVGEDKVRGWIRRGELRAINTAAVLCGRARWVVPVDALAEFERRRVGGPPLKPPSRRRRRASVDYYPDD